MRTIAERGAEESNATVPGTWWLAGFGLLLFVAGTLAPLADIDLPMHLALGEWIVAHRAVPWTEPFAWTRAGAPYYAYSWLADVAYYLSWWIGGATALHVLNGVQLAAAGGAVVWMGNVARWRPWTTAVVLWAHVWITVAIAPYLRPQALLFALVPAAWALTLLLFESTRPVASAVALFVTAAVAANVHLAGALVALPFVLVVAVGSYRRDEAPRPWRRLGIAATALAAGFLSSPYGLAATLRLNAGQNALLHFPSPVAELRPGFVGLSLREPSQLAGLALAMLPWAAARLPSSTRARVVYSAVWLTGLVAFATVGRSLFVWWLALLALVGIVIDRVAAHMTPLTSRATRLALAASFAVLAIQQGTANARAWPPAASPGSGARTLPSSAAGPIEPLLAWLDANSTRSVRGRLLTVFEYGSYVAWRSPHLSESIDGRTIFPDSAAAPDAFGRALDGRTPLGPWRSADLALVPLRYPVATVLDTAAGWRRVAVSTATHRDGKPAAGLWVRDAWWNRTNGSTRRSTLTRVK